ncbi:MAG TPA: metalloregulator ArsR/SmtB family transcription factor [Rhizobiaceae bacterium]|nr:metalloregulator ArsR/SmtB family transcription factor [Rhizobiaceae bacterium]
MPSKKFIENSGAAAALLALLGNDKRLAIISHIIDNEMSVGEIAEKVSLSQSALSQHLAKLRSQDLVETRRERQMIFYSCRSDAVRTLLGTLDEIFGEGPQIERPLLRRSGT